MVVFVLFLSSLSVAIGPRALAEEPEPDQTGEIFEDTCEDYVANCPGVRVPPNPQCYTEPIVPADGTVGFFVWRDYWASAIGYINCERSADRLAIEIEVFPSRGGAPRSAGFQQKNWGDDFEAETPRATAKADGVPNTCIDFSTTGEANYEGMSGDDAQVTVTYTATRGSGRMCN